MDKGKSTAIGQCATAVWVFLNAAAAIETIALAVAAIILTVASVDEDSDLGKERLIANVVDRINARRLRLKKENAKETNLSVFLIEASVLNMLLNQSRVPRRLLFQFKLKSHVRVIFWAELLKKIAERRSLLQRGQIRS